jgi:hypothetical protein
MENFMTKAHRLARQIKFDENIRLYRKALSLAMKQLYYHIRTMNNAKNDLTGCERYLIVSSAGYLEIDNEGFKNQIMVNKLAKYAYKDWPAYELHTFYFSEELIENLKN